MKRFSVVLAAITAFVPLLMAVSPAGAQALEPDPVRDSARKQQAGIWPLHGIDPTLDNMDDLEPLRQLIGEAWWSLWASPTIPSATTTA